MIYPAKRKWSEEEIEKLAQMKARGASNRAVASVLGRTERSVEAHIEAFGIKGGPSIISSVKARQTVKAAAGKVAAAGEAGKVAAAPIPLIDIMRRCRELGYGVDYGKYTASADYRKDIEGGYYQ